ncbi:MAG: hypothetical protein ACTSO3_17045 [Candidatus Heimdallarchaeaceae archaeon]
MASIWKVGSADVYVDEWEESKDPIIVEHNPINGNNSYYHLVSTPDDLITIAGHVVGRSHVSSLRSEVGSLITLISDDGGPAVSGITMLFDNYKVKRLMSNCQTIDTTLPTDSPVHRVTITLRR